MRIENDKVVSIDYTLRLADGEVVDTTEGHEPLAYLHGHSQLIPGLESQLAGLEVGESKQVIVPPAQGYGKFVEGAEVVLSAQQFPPENPPQVGMGILLENETGQQLPYYIQSVDSDQVVLTANHPLAGKDLHFDVTIVAVRDAEPEELSHGHVHSHDGPH